MQNTWFQFPEWGVKEDFKREVYIETADPLAPIVLRVNQKTWTFILKAKTTEKITKLMLSTSVTWKITVNTNDILLEN